MKKHLIWLIPVMAMLAAVPNTITAGGYENLIFCGVVGIVSVMIHRVFIERGVIDWLIKYFLAGLTLGAIVGILAGVYITGDTHQFPAYGFIGGFLYVVIRTLPWKWLPHNCISVI